MANPGPLRIVITGGSGQLGQILARHFHERGNRVTVIARNVKSAEWGTLTWNACDPGEWVDSVQNSDILINLAGRSVHCRYTDPNRREIRNSRTISTGLISNAIASATRPPRVWLNASTVSIYPHSLDRPMDELTGGTSSENPGASDRWQFSMEVAKDWERALFAAELPRTRRVALRSGMVMSPYPDGMFDRLLRLVRYGLGGAAGSGEQYVSWIHNVDFVRAVQFLIQHEDFNGPVNVCSPFPLPNREFMCNLRRAWCTSYVGISSAEWMLEVGALMLGTETELMLKSRRVVPRRLMEAGFSFCFPNWRGACTDLVARWRELNAN